MEIDNKLSYQNYLELFSQVRDYAIIMLDRKGVVRDWNIGAEQIKGYKPEEIIGKNFRLFYPAEDQEKGKPEGLLEKAYKEGFAQDEGWRVRKDGSRFWGIISITALWDESGRLLGFGKVTRDLTDKRNAEIKLLEQTEELRRKQEELVQSEMRFRHMMLEVQDYAMILTDTEGNIQNWNIGARKIKGYEAEEIIGKNFRVFYTPEDRKSGKPGRLLSIAKSEGRVQDEGYRVQKSGNTFWGSVTITAIHNDSGELIGFSKVTRDLSERKAAEDEKEKQACQLEAKNHELEQFATIASHDLQEPLYTISSFVTILEKELETKLDQNTSDYLRYISEAAKRMRGFVVDLLTYSRLGNNLELEQVKCNLVLKNVEQDLAGLINETRAEISYSKLPDIIAYETELRLLFQNLLSNAIKFSKPQVSPRVEVSCMETESHHKFAFRDNGIGIEKENQDEVFRIFKRLYPQSTYSGTGVGLARCRKIVELHGGRIWVDSKPGEGSTFYFTISKPN